jgi:hypothetical protein
MLDHLKNQPDEWSISRTSASFPKEGAKQIYLSYDKDRWTYSIPNFGNETRDLGGHFGAEFGKELARINSNRERDSLLRLCYPNSDGPLLLR